MGLIVAPALLAAAMALLTVLFHVRRRRRRAAAGAPAETPAGAARSLRDVEDEGRPTGGVVRRPARGQSPERAVVAVFAADAFVQAVEQARRSVVLEGGVYRIRQELYGRQPGRRASLRRTAEQAITDDKLSWLQASGRRGESRMPVRPDGLAYDQLLAQYTDPAAPTTRVGVLEEQRAALEAAVALLLAKRGAAYRCRFVAGSTPCMASDLVLGEGNALYDEYLYRRRYVVAEQGSGLAAALPAEVGQPENSRLALLPAVVDGGAAYLVFAGSAAVRVRDDAWPWSDRTLIEVLNLHP